MSDHFNYRNVLALDADTDSQQTSRITYRWKWYLTVYRGRIIAAVASILFVVGLIIDLAVINISRNTEKDETVCLTPECIHTASAILKSLNQEIVPCDNFYNFTCGGYLDSAPIPDGETSVSHFSELREDILIQIKSIIDEPATPDEPRHVELVRTLYRTCMNTAALENAGLEPLYKILDKLGGWPVLDGDDWVEDDFNWLQATYKARSLGYPGNQFLDLNVIPHTLIGSRYMFQLKQPSLGLSGDVLIKGFQDNEDLIDYAIYMRDIAEMLGAEEHRVSYELQEVLAFERALATISMPAVNKSSLDVMTLENMTKRYPIVDWVEFVNNMLPSSVRFGAQEIVLIMNCDYIGELENLLERTDNRVQANYMLWQIVEKSIPFLSKNVRERQLEYSSSTLDTGIESRQPRWRQCIEFVASSSLSHSVNARYVRRYFNEEGRQNVVEMVNGIREELIKVLKKADWVNETTKDKAIEKALSMHSSIAYPVELLDKKVLEKFYTDTEISAENFLDNVLELNRMLFNLEIDLLMKPGSIKFMHDVSTTVNAFYFFHENSLTFPAAILQGTFFNKDRPQYINYGAIGSIIGHEFSHGFDNLGVLYDKDGNFFDWWAPNTKNEYLKRTRCISEQYSNYTAQSAGKKIDGLTTLERNVADIGGFRKAYLAYIEWVKKNGPEPKLPGLNYTQEQMFWISAGSLWCKRFTDPAEDEVDPSDSHSPYRFRVIRSFSNLPEFAADFNCPTGSYMNPIHKCSLF